MYIFSAIFFTFAFQCITLELVCVCVCVCVCVWMGNKMMYKREAAKGQSLRTQARFPGVMLQIKQLKIMWPWAG